jgi:hypothetical protein
MILLAGHGHGRAITRSRTAELSRPSRDVNSAYSWRMPLRDKIEALVIALVTVAVALVRARLPIHTELADVVLGAAALLLSQGLVRDLVRLREARRAAAAAPRKITCVCAESGIGVSAIVAGLVLVAVVSPIVLHVPSFAWPLGVAGVMVFGFTTRHLVLDWRERRFRWEAGHDGTVVWKK